MESTLSKFYDGSIKCEQDRHQNVNFVQKRKAHDIWVQLTAHTCTTVLHLRMQCGCLNLIYSSRYGSFLFPRARVFSAEPLFSKASGTRAKPRRVASPARASAVRRGWRSRRARGAPGLFLFAHSFGDVTVQLAAVRTARPHKHARHAPDHCAVSSRAAAPTQPLSTRTAPSHTHSTTHDHTTHIQVNNALRTTSAHPRLPHSSSTRRRLVRLPPTARPASPLDWRASRHRPPSSHL